MRYDQPQDDAGAALQRMEATDTREGFARLLRLMFDRTGRSTNDFEEAHGKPGRIDAQLQGASQIILLTESSGDCLSSPAVWGDPRVS
ncbi:hypothetical protein ABZZ80_11620 [Streptomyces sp. NPDC006356]